MNFLKKFKQTWQEIRHLMSSNTFNQSGSPILVIQVSCPQSPSKGKIERRLSAIPFTKVCLTHTPKNFFQKNFSKKNFSKNIFENFFSKIVFEKKIFQKNFFKKIFLKKIFFRIGYTIYAIVDKPVRQDVYI